MKLFTCTLIAYLQGSKSSYTGHAEWHEEQIQLYARFYNFISNSSSSMPVESNFGRCLDDDRHEATVGSWKDIHTTQDVYSLLLYLLVFIPIMAYCILLSVTFNSSYWLFNFLFVLSNVHVIWYPVKLKYIHTHTLYTFKLLLLTHIMLVSNSTVCILSVSLFRLTKTFSSLQMTVNNHSTVVFCKVFS